MAFVKTRFVVRRGSTRVGGEEGSGDGRERANFSCAGAKIEYVPVPVRSGRCSPVVRISCMRLRYWYSSCAGMVGEVVEVGVVMGFEVIAGGLEGASMVSSAEGGIAGIGT